MCTWVQHFSKCAADVYGRLDTFVQRPSFMFQLRKLLMVHAYDDILDNSVLPILWQNFSKGPWQGPRKAMDWLDLTPVLTSTPFNTFLKKVSSL